MGDWTTRADWRGANTDIREHDPRRRFARLARNPVLFSPPVPLPGPRSCSSCLLRWASWSERTTITTRERLPNLYHLGAALREAPNTTSMVQRRSLSKPNRKSSRRTSPRRQTVNLISPSFGKSRNFRSWMILPLCWSRIQHFVRAPSRSTMLQIQLSSRAACTLSEWGV